MKCERCNGKGYLEQFKNVNGGECFKCDATGIVGGTVKLPKPKFNTYSDEVALSNAFKRINNEHNERKLKIQEVKDMDAKLKEEMESEEFESFTW